MRRRLLALALLACASAAEATDITVGGNTYTLPDHPRVMLDGAAGTVVTRLKDPDGAGPLVSSLATDANPAFVGLKLQIRGCRAAPTYCSNMSERSASVLLMALDWYMDNSQTESLAAVEWSLNNLETWFVTGYVNFGFGCDVSSASGCGLSSFSDWPSWDLGVISQAYSLVRSEMSAGERTALAQKIFNDDEDYYEDTCTNQLQQEVGAVATYATGSTAVTGSGLSGLTAGRNVYIKPYGTAAGSWATIQTVNSDASVTLVTAPQAAMGGGSAPGVTAGIIYELKPWTSTTCGVAWMLQHHPYTPRDLALNDFIETATAANYTAAATTITIASVAGMPAPPFYLRLATGAEIVRVTNVVGVAPATLTVERGLFGSTAVASQSPPRPVYYARYLPTIGTSDFAHNLVMQKLYGFLMAGLALADDSAKAVQYAGWAADVWLTQTYPKNKDMWTGFQQGGSTTYGPGRQLTENFSFLTALKNIPAGGSPSLDKTGGNWLTRFTEGMLYSTFPGTSWAGVPWGQGGIAEWAEYYSNMWAPFQTYLFGENSTQAAYWNYYQRDIANQYVGASLTSGANERLVPWALMFWQETDTKTDYRAVLPTQKVFNEVDGDPIHALNFWVSRTGWSSNTDTVLFQSAHNLKHALDHIGAGAPGAFRVYKNGWLLADNASSNTGEGITTNMLRFGSVANLKSVTAHQRVDMDRGAAGTGWAYTRTNSVGAYLSAAAATRALRHLVHFKKAASPDYIVQYDDMATSSAKALGMNLFYDKTTGEASSITDTLPDIVLTGPNRRLSTKVVLPTGTGVARTPTSTTYAFQEYLCASADGATCANASAAEFLIVHKPAASAGDTMPTVAALGTIDSDYVGVQIEGEAPSVAVFPKAGASQTSTSFTSTHAGTAQYVVTGLEAGIYDVVRGVTTIVDDQTLDANGTIGFESVAGAFAITRAGEVPAITITTTTLSSGVLNQPYSATLAYEGGTPPVAWNVSAGTLCTGLSLSAAGVISGTPTVVQTCNFTARVVDDLSAEDTQALTLTIQSPSPTLTVSAAPGSTSVVVTFGTPGLDESQSCEVVVSNALGPVGSATSDGGGSTRSVTISGLTPSTAHTANVTCGTVASGSTSFTTLAAPASGTVSWKFTFKPHAKLVARGAAVLRMSYATAPGGTPTVTAGDACSTGCTVSLPLQRGQTYAIYYQWRTAGDALVATSRSWYIAVP
jgi:hypothetical protein